MKKMCIFDKTKRVIAVVLAALMMFMLPAVHIEAASGSTKYVKTFRLYIKKHASYDDAVKWCESQGSDWHAVQGDLNEGAESKLKDKIGVFLCYETTTDRKEAVTDIAVMNEKGNYSESSYKRILEQQRQIYNDMVEDMHAMLIEYRKNVNASVPTAIQAKKTMNSYIDPDSGKRLGDLLMDVSDNDLAEILFQANGKIVMLVQEQLAYASDTSDRTWLDRMSMLGRDGDAYGALLEKAKNSYNGDEQRAEKALKDKYNEAAAALRDKFGDIRSHLIAMLKYQTDNGLTEMSDADRDAWLAARKDDPKLSVYMIEKSVSTALSSYKYEKTNLLDYFLLNDTEFEGDGIRKLYPLAASLTDAQRAALRESTDLYTLVNAAITSTAQDNLKKGKAAELTEEDKKKAEALSEKTEEALSEAEKGANPISIYDGVDRDIYADGGVAVTSTAETYKNENNGNWIDGLTNGDMYLKLTIGTGAAALGTAIGAAIMSRVISCWKLKIGEIGYKNVGEISSVASASMSNTEREIARQFLDENNLNDLAIAQRENWYADIVKVSKMSKSDMAEGGYSLSDKAQMKAQLEEFYNHGVKVSGNTVKAAVFQTIKWGLAIASILLAAADIALNAYKLYKYYNTDHLPIPHHMVDISYDQTKKTKFISYKNVLTQEKSSGDVNGGGGRQWLALYETHDESAGAPILAPENGEAYTIDVVYGKETTDKAEHSPLHMFGTPSTPQNLTYSDGESGYSYNDGKKRHLSFFQKRYRRCACRGTQNTRGKQRTDTKIQTPADRQM